MMSTMQMTPANVRAGAATVLVVDDEASIRLLLTRLLEPLGYPVVTAADGESALALMGSVNPAVVVCDVHMPGRTGLWLADQIRQLFPATAVVLATGDSRVPPAHTLRRGVMAYLLKPVRPSELVRAVNEGICWSRHQVLGH